MPEEGYNLPSDFDLSEGFTAGQGENPTSLADIASEMGWTDWYDIVAANDSYDEADLRPGIYTFAEDAIQDAYDRGILEFSEIWFDGEYWHLVVDYEEP